MDRSAKNNRISIFIRLMLLVVPLFALSIAFEQAGLFVLTGIVFAVLYFLFFRKYLWLLLVLAPPSLCVGDLIDIPVTANWVYEARAAEIFLIIATLLFFLDSYLNRRIANFRIDAIALALYLYMMASIASILYIIDFRLFVFGLKVAVYAFISYFLARQLLDSKKKIEAFLMGISATVIILSLQIYYKFYELGFSSKFFFERNTILLPIGPIATTAAILALLVPLLLAFYFQLSRTRILRPFVILAVVLGLTAVFLSLGKGAIASLLVGLLFLFVKMKNSRIPLLLMGLWFVFLSYILLNPFFSGLLVRIKSTFVDTNTRFRVLEYETSWELIKDHLLFGVGSGQQLHYFKEMLDFETAQLVNNFFVQAQIDLGLVGLGLVFTLLIAIMVKARKAVRSSLANGGYYMILLYGFAASLIVAFLNGLVEVTFFALPYAIIFWLLMGVYSNVQQLAKSFK
jgi:O-antigen ligase